MSRYPTKSEEIPIDSKNEIFNSSMNPIWVAQMSDLHISPIYNESLQRVKDTFNYIPKNVNPAYLLLTGDITDNLDEVSVWSPAYPHEDHFKLYKEIRETSKIKDDQLIEILGNHDVWGRKNFDDYYKYFVNGERMRKNLYVQTYTKGDLRVISFIPIHFPTGHTTYLFVIPMYKEMLDSLEESLEAPSSAKYTIFSMHFTTGMMCPLESIRSSRTGRNLKEILSDPKYNVVAMINGHTHPKANEWLHYGKTIELTSTSLLDRDGFNVFSIDNSRINYQKLFTNDTMPSIVTCPTPDLISTRIFNDKDFQVRVVSLNSLAKNFHIEIDHAVKFELQFDRELDGGSSLYSHSVHLEAGEHNIEITGDLNQSFNFSISQKVGPFYENKFADLKGWVMIVWFIFIVIYQLIVLISEFVPYQIDSISKYCDEIIMKENSSSKWNVLRFLFAGPIITGYLLRKLALFEKMILVVITIAPFCMPIGIEIIEGEIGFWTVYGIFLDGKSTYDVVSEMFEYLYLGYTACGFQFLFCLALLPKDLSFVFDFAYTFVLTVGGTFFWRLYGGDSKMTKFQNTTFQFHLIPIFGFITWCLFLMKKRKKEIKVKQS